MKCCMFEKIEDPKQKALLDKINVIGLALFLVLIGVLWLLPEGTLPGSTWALGLGLILLGGNIARHLNGIQLCHCTAVVGIVLLISGICGLFGVEIPVLPILIIIAGIGIGVGIVTKKTCCQGTETNNTKSGGQKTDTKTED